ncbi:hypothetical protein H2203_003100 [Taxawa tesnikishii (nom. ined.)]|nr:hypothetical protein H2203_003100 [Dothideales sp. JES 119]
MPSKNNLQFESNEPAFLRRLRAQNSGNDTDRHERAIARPRKPKDAASLDEDAPTYVVEDSGDTLTKAEYDALMSGNGGKAGDAETPGVTGQSTSDEPEASGSLPAEEGVDDAERKKQAIMEAGKASKKRKVAKVVGGEDDDDDDEPADEKDGNGNNAPAAASKAAKKPKKKAKAIKLSFGDE